MDGTHPEHEDFPWTIAVVDHPPRADTAAYRASRSLMHTLAGTVTGWPFEPPPFEDHHGGGLWVKDDQGWLCLLVSLGIEWSAQFCADPAKVDRLRQQAARVIAAFPATLPGYAAAGYTRAQQLLARPIRTAEDVAAWTDSIFNASVPLPRLVHTGTLPGGAGYRHYPKPIVDTDHVRYDDFQLFVTDPAGFPAAVVPVAPRGSGDGRVRLLAAHPGSPYAQRLTLGRGHPDGVRAAAAASEAAVGPVLSPDDPLARAAFRRQT